METSRLESSQHAVTPKNAKLKHNIRLAQETGTFACKHCPFRTLYKRSLALHEKHHSSNHPFQCSFCTFSSKSELNLVVEHINRVHLEELKANGYLKHPVIDSRETINVEPTREERPENLSPPKSPVHHQNDIPKTAADVEMDEDEEEVFMVSEEELEEMSCLCGQPQPAYGDGSAVSCSQCDDRFHGHCVDITPKVYEEMDELEEPWICPHCLNKATPITHDTTLSQQVVNTSAKQWPPSSRYRSSSLAKSEDGYLEPQSQNANLSTTSETPATLLLPQEEEAVYSLERSNIVQEIQRASERITDMKKSLEDEAQELQMCRSRAANDLRKKIEEIEKDFRSQSVHLVVLKEQSERFQQKLNDLRSQKIQLEKDIINLMRPGSVGKIKLKIKLKPIASESSSVDFGEEIRKKKHLLKVAKEKIHVIQREDTDWAARIRGVEEEMGENTLKLEKMRDDLKSLPGNWSAGTAPSSSALADQLKAIIGEQRIRIKRFTWLEMTLAKIDYQRHLVEIRREEEQWLNYLKHYRVETK